LKRQLQGVQEEISDLEEQQTQSQRQVRSQLQELQHVAHEMEQSANVCSMVTAMK
jgi:hypothetical protein